MATTAERLKIAMELRNMKQVDLVERTGIGKSSISTYISGEYLPKQRNIYKLAQALNVSETWLMGFDVEMERSLASEVAIKTKRVPLLGKVAAGKPIFAVEEHDAYIEVDEDLHIDFCLKVKGDSMINARILDGDLVFVKKQATVDNGEIAVVLIDDEVTLKRFYRTDAGIILKPENTNYEPRFYTASDFKDVRVLGKAILFQSKL